MEEMGRESKEIEPPSLLEITTAVVVLCDLGCAVIFILASVYDAAFAAGGMMNWALWRVLPVVALINLMYVGIRLLSRPARYG